MAYICIKMINFMPFESSKCASIIYGITQIFTCTALTFNGLQKISQIPMPCDNEGLVTCYVGKSGDET